MLNWQWRSYWSWQLIALHLHRTPDRRCLKLQAKSKGYTSIRTRKINNKVSFHFKLHIIIIQRDCLLTFFHVWTEIGWFAVHPWKNSHASFICYISDLELFICWCIFQTLRFVTGLMLRMSILYLHYLMFFPLEFIDLFDCVYFVFSILLRMPLL